MAVRIVDPAQAQWAVKRQDALLKAEEVLTKMVKYHDLEEKMNSGKKLTKKEADFVRSFKSVRWSSARRALQQLDDTHPRMWDKTRV